MNSMEGGAIPAGDEAGAPTGEPRAPEFALAPEAVTPAPVPPPAPAASGHHFGRRLAAAITLAIIAATGGGIGIGWTVAGIIDRAATHASVQTVHPISQAPSNGGTSLSAAAIAAKVDPAIVDLNTVLQTSTGTGQAAGTGLILTSSGYVLTNNHVVAGSVSIKVTIQGHGTHAAEVVGVDPTADLAVIKVEGVSGLPTVTFADSSTVQVGDTVYALGNALGLGGTPRETQGSVTALDQTITASEGGANSEQLSGMIQSDTVISPGDSGGPLVNSAGQVVGIITAGEATGFRNTTSTVAYAIPSNTARDIANQILSGQTSPDIIYGKVGYLGVNVQTLDAETAAQLGLSITAGALVRSVQSGSPAESAGIPRLAVITGVAGTSIDSANALGDALHAYKPGAQVKITWVDTAGMHSANVTLVSGPAV
jgi:S1-C subfamily serine protease